MLTDFDIFDAWGKEAISGHDNIFKCFHLSEPVAETWDVVFWELILDDLLNRFEVELDIVAVADAVCVRDDIASFKEFGLCGPMFTVLLALDHIPDIEWQASRVKSILRAIDLLYYENEEYTEMEQAQIKQHDVWDTWGWVDHIGNRIEVL